MPPDPLPVAITPWFDAATPVCAVAVVGGLLGGVQTRGLVTLMGSGRLRSHVRVALPWRRVNHFKAMHPFIRRRNSAMVASCLGDSGGPDPTLLDIEGIFPAEILS